MSSRSFRRVAPAALLLVAVALAAAPARADNTMTVQTMFEAGRAEASAQLATVRDCSFGPATGADVRAWIMQAKDALLADLQATPQLLVQAEQSSCLVTAAGDASPETLSIPACLREVPSAHTAAQLLLAASAKHLGVGLAHQAVLIAAGVIDATRNCNDAGMQLDAGGDHTCLLRAGKVACFGSNDFGESNVPDLVNAKLLAVGDEHTCALDAFGVKCWGNPVGQLLEVPGLWNVRALAAGGRHTCAIHDDGVLCWGYDSAFDGVPAMRNPREIGVGGDFACAIADDGVHCWARSTREVPQNLHDPHHLRVGVDTACVISDDKLVCWGDSNNSHQNDVPPEAFAARDFDVGSRDVCALLDNRVRCWGESESGQTRPSQLTHPRLVSIGVEHSCAVDDEGVKCWGANTHGQTKVPPELAHFAP